MRKNVVVGYTVYKKNRNRAAIALTILVVLAVTGAFFLFSLNPQEVAKPAPPPRTEKIVVENKNLSQVEVLAQAVCRKIEINQPADTSSLFRAEEKAYFYTKILFQNVPQTIRHEWRSPDGKVVAAIPLYIVSQPADTWSYITLPPGENGEWQVRIVTGEKVLAMSKFSVLPQ